jgi:predicted Na+-dependent transporter
MPASYFCACPATHRLVRGVKLSKLLKGNSALAVTSYLITHFASELEIEGTERVNSEMRGR